LNAILANRYDDMQLNVTELGTPRADSLDSWQ